MSLLLFFKGGSTTAYTLNAEAGSFTLSGQAAELLRSRAFNAEATSFSLSGQPATFTRGLVFTAEAGSFALAGQDATLVYTTPNVVLNAEAGVFSLNGQDAQFALTTAGATPQRGAGRARKRYRVEIDDQSFEVSSADEAQALLAQARQLAEQRAEQALQRSLKAQKRPKRQVLKDARKALPEPRVTVSGDDAVAQQILLLVQGFSQEIALLYRSTLQTIEIGALMRRVHDEQDEEDALLALLL